MSTILLNTDVTTRLQLGAKVAALKTQLLVAQLSYGGDSITKGFYELETLINRLRVLEDIKTPVTEVRAHSKYDYSSWTPGTSFQLVMTFTGSTLPTYTSSTSASISAAMTSLYNLINADTTTGLTCSLDLTNQAIYVQAPVGQGSTPNNVWYITFTAVGSSKPGIVAPTLGSYFVGGITAVTASSISNCLTDAQYIKIFEDISKDIKVAFKPLGYTYTAPLLNAPIGVVGRAASTGGYRQTSTGANRVFNTYTP